MEMGMDISTSTKWDFGFLGYNFSSFQHSECMAQSFFSLFW